MSSQIYLGLRDRSCTRYRRIPAEHKLQWKHYSVVPLTERERNRQAEESNRQAEERNRQTDKRNK